MLNAQGQCLCGKVKMRAQIAEKHAEVCHCGMCRTWGGGPLFGVPVGAAENVRIEGEQHVTVYSSSEWADRGFCKYCGTHLFYRLKDGSFYDIPAGLLDDMDGFKLQTQIFIDRKPDFYNFVEATENMTEAEVMAKFAPPDQK
ncbi:MAG: GFA family protein [Pseudomonadota bacterium]